MLNPKLAATNHTSWLTFKLHQASTGRFVRTWRHFTSLITSPVSRLRRKMTEQTSKTEIDANNSSTPTVPVTSSSEEPSTMNGHQTANTISSATCSNNISTCTPSTGLPIGVGTTTMTNANAGSTPLASTPTTMPATTGHMPNNGNNSNVTTQPATTCNATPSASQTPSTNIECADDDSEDESEILEESPCGRWLKRREEVEQRDIPGIDATFLAMDTEEGVEVVWNEVRFSERKYFNSKEENICEVFDRLILLSHPNIVKLHKYWMDKDVDKPRVIFITEYMSSGSLKLFLKKTKKNDVKMSLGVC